jgi:hypothetical protein
MTSPLLSYNTRQLRAQFNQRPFYVKHQLGDHPLFDIERLLKLAQSLPPANIEYNSGQLEINQDPGRTPMNGLSAVETIARIRDCKSWMVMKFVETDPEYRDLLHALLKDIVHDTADIAPDARRFLGFIFLSSPGAVTPYHMDGEHNFLLQIRGSKMMHVWSPDDRYVVTQEQLERFHARHPHRNLPYDPSFDASAYKLPMRAGDGIHVPVTSPHWVKVDDEVSISFSITFRSRVSAQSAFTNRTCCRLRELGIRPPAAGRYPMVEKALYATSGLWRALRGVREEG